MISPSLLPRPPTKKWVTFDDLLEDALESGKLNKIESDPRRSSVTGSSIRSSSVSSIDSLQYAMESNGRSTTHSPLDFSQSLGHDTSQCGPEIHSGLEAFANSTGSSGDEDPIGKDKYSVFTNLKPKQCQGWSKRVLLGGTGKFGWSEEILGLEGSASETEEEINPTRPDGLDGLSRINWPKVTSPSWDTSPSRTFLRNFP